MDQQIKTLAEKHGFEHLLDKPKELSAQASIWGLKFADKLHKSKLAFSTDRNTQFYEIQISEMRILEEWAEKQNASPPLPGGGE